jgi:hypothetical protein
VRAPIEDVAGLFARLMGAAAWRRDVYGQRIPNTWPDCWWSFTQLKGHPWTSAEYLRGPSGPEEVARHLMTEVIVYGYAKVTSTGFYELYDGEGLAERFQFTPSEWLEDNGDRSSYEAALRGRWHGPFRFESRCRDVDFAKVNDGFAFIDAFFRDHDAYVYPPPRFSYAEQDESGRDVERADLVQVLREQASAD